MGLCARRTTSQSRPLRGGGVDCEQMPPPNHRGHSMAKRRKGGMQSQENTNGNLVSGLCLVFTEVRAVGDPSSDRLWSDSRDQPSPFPRREPRRWGDDCMKSCRHRLCKFFWEQTGPRVLLP